MVVGALLAAAVGALLGFPIIRLAGIYPALATLAFALMFESVIVPLEWVSGGDVPVPVPRPLIGSIDMASDRPYLIFCVLCLAVLGLAVIAIRKGTTGRFLDALRGSEPAAASIGIHPYRTRLVAFVVGAGIAGFGGGLLASYNGQANYTQSFTFYFGLVWLVLVITTGFRSVQAAVIGGITFFLFPQILQRLFAWPGNYLASHPDITGVPQSILEFVEPEWSLGVAFILFGIGALTYAKHPEGVIEAQTTASIRRILLLIDKRRGGTLAAQEAAIDLELAGGASHGRPTPSDAGGARRRAGHPMTAVDAAPRRPRPARPRSSPSTSASASRASPRWWTCRSASTRASSWPSSGPTAPASPPCSAASRATSGPTPVASP